MLMTEKGRRGFWVWKREKSIIWQLVKAFICQIYYWDSLDGDIENFMAGKGGNKLWLKVMKNLWMIFEAFVKI